MEFSVLGPLEVRADGRALPLGGVKPRGLLAFLLLHADEPVSADRLALALWGEDAPAGAPNTVQVYVSRLRSALGDNGVLATTPAGYRARVRPDELDADRFARLVTDGRRILTDRQPDRAVALLEEALALWRGPPLAELASLPFAAAEIARLEEQRLEAVELRMQAALEAGRHAELVAELRPLVRAHPWRERLHAHLMLALYRSGRQADALDAYREARGVLVGELGIEPGEELTELHSRILAHDPELAAPMREGFVGGLPVPPNATIGREEELEAIVERLGSARLLTLTGPGGVGKTRLAVEAARAVGSGFPDGALFVPLAALQRSDDVPMTLVGAIGAVLLDGESPERAVRRHLARRQALLVLDNCEHLLAIAPFVARILESCPRVTVLATSREPLALQAEQRVPVSPLPGDGAAALFAARARAHDPALDLGDGSAVADICRRVDGLPLAVELAAARCTLLSPAEIAQRLDAALGTLGPGARDAPARHRTLRATIDWSHALLDEPEQGGFARFAVFAGGATVDAAEAVSGADLDTLDRLVAKSLLVRHRGPGGATRLVMLDTIRAFAGERFAKEGDAGAVKARHTRHYLLLAQRHSTDRELSGADRMRHLAELDAELGNLNAALEHTLTAEDAESALRLCVALGRYWQTRARHAEAAGWIERAVALLGSADHPGLKASALCHLATALHPLGRRAEQGAILDEAEVLARGGADVAILVRVLHIRAAAALAAEDLAGSNALADEATRLAQESGDPWLVAVAAGVKAEAAETLEALRERVERAVSLLQATGNAYRIAEVLCSASYAALCLGGDDTAREFAGRALPLAHDLDNPFLQMVLAGNIGLAALMTGDSSAARRSFREELTLCRRLAALPYAAEALSGLAMVAVEQDDLARAALLHGAGGAHRYGQPEDALVARVERDVFAPARDRFGAENWDACSAGGAALEWEDAIACGFED
jgi:predicted ATPase/DNA-binding SARP family transcriptional activator